MVDGYINGQNAIAQASVNIIRNAAFTEAGGEAKYMEAITWAKDGLAAGEIAAFDKAVTGNDPAAAKVAVRSLMAAFAKAGGAEPTNLATGGTNGTGGTYTSVEQMLVDMNDPRYASDPAFRKRVEQKVARSNI